MSATSTLPRTTRLWRGPGFAVAPECRTTHTMRRSGELERRLVELCAYAYRS